ncbi:MAG: HAD family hydrolase [Clostridia bacterium]|nr:HAD family hydrolase [Clostridia bacterium]
MIKAVIFDLDGTLVNSLKDLCSSTNYALKKYGYLEHEEKEYNYLVGEGMVRLIKQALPENERETETFQIVFDEFYSHYRNHYLDKTAPYENIPQCIEQLKNAGVKLAVVSNKADEMTQKVVSKFFDGDFSVVTGKRENYPAKPDPALTLEIIKQLGVTPQECAFVGDSGVDMATARNAGCKAVGVLWGFRLREELVENGAEYLLSNANEIAPLVLGIK